MAKKAKKQAAKKVAAKKAKKAAAKRAPVKVTKWSGGAERAKAAKQVTRAAAQVPLIKGLRIRSLDNVCASIADTRAAINRLKGEEADLERHAHKLLTDHKQTTWQSAGVTLVLVPGQEKLIVKTSRNNSTAEAPPVPPVVEDVLEDQPAPGLMEADPAQPPVDDEGDETDEA